MRSAFSNGSGDPKQCADGHDDGRGLAIKLFGVPGEKILETDRGAMTQDFAMINISYFFANDPRTYLILLEKARGGLLTKLTVPLALGPEGTGRINAFGSGRISDPLQIQHFRFRLLAWGPARIAKPSSGRRSPSPTRSIRRRKIRSMIF
jgi:hypothetical protein